MGELSRHDLVQWVNELLQLNYTKIEQLGSGAAYCQLVDAVHGARARIARGRRIPSHRFPRVRAGDVRLDRVKFDAKQEFEFMANFKVLQETFTKHKIDKVRVSA